MENLKNLNWRYFLWLEIWLSSEEDVLVFQRVWLSFLDSMLQLTAFWCSRSRVSNTLSWLLWAHAHVWHLHTYTQLHTHKHTWGIESKYFLKSNYFDAGIPGTVWTLEAQLRAKQSCKSKHFPSRWISLLKRNALSHFNKSPNGKETHKVFQVLSILFNQVVALLARASTCWETEAIAHVDSHLPAALKGDCCGLRNYTLVDHSTSLLPKPGYILQEWVLLLK